MSTAHPARDAIGQACYPTCPDYCWAGASRMLAAAVKAQVKRYESCPTDPPGRPGQALEPTCPPPPHPMGAGAGQPRADREADR